MEQAAYKLDAFSMKLEEVMMAIEKQSNGQRFSQWECAKQKNFVKIFELKCKICAICSNIFHTF